MAKILGNLLPNFSKRVMKLRQAYEWTLAEIDALEEKYKAKKEKEINKFIRSANKSLKKSAYKACDKREYAEAETEAALQKYDVKKYLSQRGINHKAAKAIFKAIRSGEDWSSAVCVMEKEKEALDLKRQAYLDKLTFKESSFIEKNDLVDSEEYEIKRRSVDESYVALREKLDKKYALLLEKEKISLQRKADLILARIEAERNKQTDVYQLDDDVILSIRDLKMYFGGLHAVDELSFDVKKGEIFGLIGPNGAGKTTVFNCITQFYKPTAGELLFRTKEGETLSLTDYQVHDIVLKGIARTFQNVEVVKEVSVIDNLKIAATRNYRSNLFVQMFHLPLLKREDKIITAKADKILNYMNLTAYKDRLAWGLPYGILKRIEIARALMCSPQLIILDEPAAGLNESETGDLAELIKKIRSDFDCTVLLVEHDMSLVMSVCDHICAISFGKKLACGTPKEVQSSKAVQEAYLGVGEE